jgi:hypothetical protein
LRATGRGRGGVGAADLLRARARTAAAAVIAAFLGWMAVNWIGGALGLPVALALAADIACLAVLGWALVTLIGIWRTRRDEGR